jgi:predicted nucleic acid-binding protein
MTVIVADASVLAPALADDGLDGEDARARLQGERLAAPDIVYLEVASVLRRLILARTLPLRRAELALDDLGAVPFTCVGHRALLGRCWELRNNVTVYDASYIAVAEALGARLVTADRRLASVPRLRCEVDLVTTGGDTIEIRPVRGPIGVEAEL